jgi:RNA polymerase sigma-70 factor (ECF subfamily)
MAEVDVWLEQLPPPYDVLRERVQDCDGLVSLLTEDVVFTMPPEPIRIEGRQAAGHFFATVPARGALDQIRLVVTRANRQPALAAYMRDPETGLHRAYGIMVLTLEGDSIAEIVGFADARLFPLFGLPGEIGR